MISVARSSHKKLRTQLLRAISSNCTSHRFLLKSLHACASKPEPSFAAKAIRSICREGDIFQARKLFDEIPEKDVFSFSAMIYGYASNGFFSESLLLFYQMQMQEFNISPNAHAFVAVLLGSAGQRNFKFTKCIHGRIIKTGLESNTFVRTSLLNSYSKCGVAIDAYKLFIEIESPKLVSWNAMIAGFVFNCEFEQVFWLFELLLKAGIMPNCITMMSVTQGSIGHGSWRLCESIHGYIVKAGFESNISLMNSVLDMYSSFRSLDSTRCFFMKMTTKDVITWTNMMSFMIELSCPAEAFQLFSQMRSTGIKADVVSMVSVITSCTLLGDLAKGKTIHGQIMAYGFGSELPVMNSLITLYSRCGDIWSAKILFDDIVNKSLVSWTAMMFGYLCNRQPREGLHLLIRMRRKEAFHLDSVTLICSLASSSEMASLAFCKELHVYSLKSGLILYVNVQNSLMIAYGRCGYADIGFRVFKEMIRRDIVSWNAMIYSYGINGEGQEAVALFQEMESCGEPPDSITFVNVLNACSHSGMVDEGLMVFEKMLKEKRIRPREEHCGCIVNMLARANRLEDAKKLADSMPEEVNSSVWKALLGGCRINTDYRFAEVAAERVFEIASDDASHFVLLSNVYASVGRFDHVESLRNEIRKKGLVKNIGFSMVDNVPHGNVEGGTA
ncbi:Pentatricopeptide repeat-containing protein [Dendrobium catenatum]|uniref:Pentatricopeptide repeat-containing protein n=2 Tax=Dendrobium catenatum TaxID=906689 RepID=A0A2I0X873_9ASPA|nr:Pentatricopeptide repeat-containing protein [Dendrobium catenatum]